MSANVPKVELISASAGSGKTTRLAKLLQESISAGTARPHAILATTFTNKAAAELQQRVRTTLLASGKVEEAQQLSASRIGTVNAVCGQLVTEFAFKLGLSPELKVLDEVTAAVALKRTLTTAVTEAEARELAELKDRMVTFDWQGSVRAIVDQARSNALAPEALRESAERSVKTALALLGRRAEDGAALEAELVAALEAFAKAVRGGPDTTKATKEVLEGVEDALRTFRARGYLSWHQWLKISAFGTKVGAKSRALAGPLAEAAAAQDTHPRLHDDIEGAIRLCFALAERALTAYARHKAEWAALDYIDQEVLALQLLERPDVQGRLREQLDLVLVDEFQDTSPLQLAIFLALARLAKRSVWVGDQKQSIFAFRGTDPALMDAALAQLLGSKAPETLKLSRRSRPALVELASDVFVPAFARHGMPEDRVRLTHPDGQEPAGLGPVLEYHRLAAKKVDAELVAIADGVAQVLADSTVRVRDRVTAAARPVKPGDVAVLCKSNKDCLGVATALAARGIAAVLPRVGLMAAVEAQVVVAGLQLLADPRDTLACATLARILEYPTAPEPFLETLVAKRQEAFADSEFSRRLATVRGEVDRAGPLAAFDAVLAALDLPARCAAWGDTSQRLANLDALRAHAVGYVQRALADGNACTTAGLVEFLRELEAAGVDDQATVTGSDAVVVSTWHRAKGLEWPVVVLHGKPRAGSALGIHVAGAGADGAQMDIAAPLAGRWLRFWPSPYHGSQSTGPFFDRLADAPEEQAAQKRALEQELRLLYVGWTRARDRLVLTGRGDTLAAGMNALLQDGDAPLLGDVGTVGADGMAEVDIAGKSLRVRVRDAQPTPGEPREAVPGSHYKLAPAASWPPAHVTPSGQAGTGELRQVAVLGDRLPLSGSPDMQLLGEALHTFLAADLRLGVTGATAAEREAFARDVLARWGVLGVVPPADVVRASDRLRAWVAQWPDARVHREWPVMLRQPNGTLLRGAADLVLETDAQWVVVDHKSFPGTREQAEARAVTYGGQLHAYRDALVTHANKPVRAFIHLPVTGMMVELDVDGAAVREVG